MKGILFGGIAVAFFVLAWMFLRLASIFSTTERAIKDVSEQVVPLLGKTHVTVDNINSQLSQLDEAVGDVAGMTGELDQTTAVITKGVRRHLPKSARDLPDNVRQRFENAVSAAREASTRRREEILRDLAAHEAHADRLAREAAAARSAEDEVPKVTETTEEGSA